jgi:hypothetical protein
MASSAWMFLCVRCHCQVMMYRHCNCGQLYCTNGCAGQARTALGGLTLSFNTARPARECRAPALVPGASRQRVTHHGSFARLGPALLLARKNT